MNNHQIFNTLFNIHLGTFTYRVSFEEILFVLFIGFVIVLHKYSK